MSTQSPAVRNRRGGRGLYKTLGTALQKSVGKGHAPKKSKKLPEYLEISEIAALMRFAPNPVARLSMELQWRAGLRISEAIKVTPADVNLEAKIPEIKVRQGKGHTDRLVPLHASWRLLSTTPSVCGGKANVTRLLGCLDSGPGPGTRNR